jgi:hypothetical protein
MAWALEAWGLPTNRVIRRSDLKASGFIGSPGQEQRLRRDGILPEPHWKGGNFCFWYPAEIAAAILTLPTVRPEKHPGKRKSEPTESGTDTTVDATAAPTKRGRGRPRRPRGAAGTTDTNTNNEVA